MYRMSAPRLQARTDKLNKMTVCSRRRRRGCSVGKGDPILLSLLCMFEGRGTSLLVDVDIAICGTTLSTWRVSAPPSNDFSLARRRCPNMCRYRDRWHEIGCLWYSRISLDGLETAARGRCQTFDQLKAQSVKTTWKLTFVDGHDQDPMTSTRDVHMHH